MSPCSTLRRQVSISGEVEYGVVWLLFRKIERNPRMYLNQKRRLCSKAATCRNRSQSADRLQRHKGRSLRSRISSITLFPSAVWSLPQHTSLYQTLSMMSTESFKLITIKLAPITAIAPKNFGWLAFFIIALVILGLLSRIWIKGLLNAVSARCVCLYGE